MRIKSMTATFGKLDRARLELGEGLNLIHAPNEGGKSTWAAFWKAMLYGIDTRDRDKKGHLAEKNRWQPWSGAPMEGEVVLEWQGRDITIRRGRRGSSPFGAFSAVYTGTGEPVPGLTADTCGPFLTGVGREVFERSAFIGAGGDLAVTAAPELERRIAALVSSGEEDVSFSQTEARLKEWLNRRRVNRSVGLIPKLEAALAQTVQELEGLEEVSGRIAQLEGERAALEEETAALTAEEDIHRRLARKSLNRRYAKAGQELEEARTALTATEADAGRFGPLPPQEELRRAQGELQYLKVLDEEIKQGEEALAQAEEACAQAQAALDDPHFAGLSGEEAAAKAEEACSAHRAALAQAQRKGKAFSLFQTAGVLLFGALTALDLFLNGGIRLWFWPGLGAYGLMAVLSALSLHRSNTEKAQAAHILERYAVQTPEELEALARNYQARWEEADRAAQQAKAVRGALNDNIARRDNSRADLLDFVHTFAPQATGLFGCSAALSRALNLEHDLALARERVRERQLRREDLAAQGGQDFDTLELLHPPARTPEETARALADAAARLDRVKGELNRAHGHQKALGDPAALAARRETLTDELARRQREYDALTMALDALREANGRLQERFSPELNRLASRYMARLTGGQYASLALNRALEGEAARTGDLLPHSSLYLSRGTVDQLYLSVRLAVCALCLPEKPPMVLDDALAAFDDHRMAQALELLRELAGEQQVLLFTCQRREGEALKNAPGVTQVELG